MLTTKEWEFAIISQDEARKAHVHWVPGRRLPEELIATAMSLGYTESELATYSIGELHDDLVINNVYRFIRRAEHEAETWSARADDKVLGPADKTCWTEPRAVRKLNARKGGRGVRANLRLWSWFSFFTKEIRRRPAW